MKLTDTQIAELLELEGKATTNWIYENERYNAKCVIGNKPQDDRWIAHFQPEFNGEINAELASQSRNALRPLLEELVVLRELAKAAKPFTELGWDATDVGRLRDAFARLEGIEC